MGGDRMVVKQAKFGISDDYRGVFLNRGVFVKAPPDFFHAYPNDFQEPPRGWERMNLVLREIPHWDKRTGMLQPPPIPPEKKEVAPPPPLPKPQSPEEKDEAPHEPPPPPVKRGRGRPRKIQL